MADPAFELAQATPPVVAGGSLLPQLTVEDQAPEQVKSAEEWQDYLRRLQAIGGQGQGGLGTSPTAPQGGVPTAAGPPLTETQPMAPGEPEAPAFGPPAPPSGGLVSAVGNLLTRAQEPQNLRGILRGVGATAGSFAGVPYGPVGVATGGYVGELTGNQIANAIDAVRVSDAPEQEKPSLVRQILENPATTAVTGTLLGRAVPLVYNTRLGWRPLMARLMRLPPNSAAMLQEAKDIGVDIGVANVTGKSGFGGGWVNIFGRMPILGSSAKNAARQQARQLMAGYNDMFGDIAEKRGLQDIADTAFQYGTNKFNDIAVRASDRFNHAIAVGTEAGSIIPSGDLKKEAFRILTEAQKRPGGAVGNLSTEARRIITDITKFPDKLSTVEVKNLDATLENIARRNSNLRFPLLDDLRRTTASMYDRVDHPAARLMKAADAGYKDALKSLDGELAKRFGTLQRNNFGTMEYRQGTLNADDVGTMLEKLKGPNQAAELRNVVGDESMQQVAKLRIDTAWENAIKEFSEGTSGIFNWKGDAFRKGLGLDQPGGRQYRLTEELLRGTGVEMSDLAKFARVADSVSRTPLADASTFAARSMILHGTRGGSRSAGRTLMQAFAGTALAGGASSGHLVESIAMSAFIRWGAGKMMQPSLLKNLTTAMDASATGQAKVQALYSLFENNPWLFTDAP